MKNIMCGYDKFCLSYKVIESFLILSALSGLVVEAENRTITDLFGPIDTISDKCLLYAERLYQYYIDPQAHPKYSHYCDSAFVEVQNWPILAGVKILKHLQCEDNDPNYIAISNTHNAFIALYDLEKYTKEKKLELVKDLIEKVKEMKTVLNASTKIYTREIDFTVDDMK
uniref:Uncharacterized protein n=1 Tax=Clastoptera arizonana TaxID=38151 RepID=A0A1B6DUP7_9HEMI